jgi:hypothetical protein
VGFARLDTEHSIVRVMATKQFRVLLPSRESGLPFSPISSDSGKSTGDVFFRFVAGRTRAVIFAR